MFDFHPLTYLYDTFSWMIRVLWFNPYLHPVSLLIEHKVSVTIWMLLFLCFVGVINQIRRFAPNAEERPLPLKYYALFGCIKPFRLIPFCLATYWLVFSIMVSFNVMYQNDFTDFKTMLFPFVIFVPLYLILGVYSFTRADYTPLIRGYLDRTFFKGLNDISTEYQLKNSGRVIYKPEGTPRITKDYEVEQYFKEGKLFHGLNLHDKPIYTDFWKSLDGHFTVIGGTGAGKGVLTRIYLYQTIKADVTNIIIDPKPDPYMYDACCTFAKEHDKKIHVIDLDDWTPQISLFKNVTASEFKNIMMSAIELDAQIQTNARIYAERAGIAIDYIAENLFEENITPLELYSKILSCPELCEQESVVNIFYYFQQCQVFNTKTGLSIKEVLESKDVVFIRCANVKTNRNARDISQIVFTALFEAISKRENLNATQCVVVVDEFKFVMNTAIMDSLATVRDQKCSLIFNFQDISNFMTSPNRALRNRDYAQELLSNSHFIAVHNVTESSLTRLIQERCGKKSYDKPAEEDKSNAGGASETSTDRRWMTHTEYALTENEVRNGGKRTAILLSPLLEGDSFERVHTNYINTTVCKFAITHNHDSEDNIIVPPLVRTEVKKESKGKGKKKQNPNNSQNGQHANNAVKGNSQQSENIPQPQNSQPEDWGNFNDDLQNVEAMYYEDQHHFEGQHEHHELDNSGADESTNMISKHDN